MIWSLLTVHGSNINRSDRDRAFALSSYVQAANSERGEWAFRGGEFDRAGRRAAALQI